MTFSPYPVGSGILRSLDATGGGGDYDSECYNERVTIDNFRNSGGRPPLMLTMPNSLIAWGTPQVGISTTYANVGRWLAEAGPATYPLVFPGTNMGGGYHRLAPDVPYIGSTGGVYKLNLTTAPNISGTFFMTGNTFDGVSNATTGITYEFAPYSSADPQYMTFKTATGVYDPTLTAVGTITVASTKAGAAGDYTQVGTDGVGTLYMASSGAWGIGLYNDNVTREPPETSPVARDLVLVRWVFRTNRLASGRAGVSLGAGNAFLTVVPSTDYAPGVRGYVEVATGEETVQQIRTDWAADTWYNAELELDLASGVARGRVYEVGDTPPEFIEAATQGERWGQGSYRPTVRIRMFNEDTDIPWQVQFDTIEADIATTGPFAAGYANSNNLVLTLAQPGSTFGNAYGVHHGFNCPQPADGRAYAVPFDGESTSRGPVGLPGIFIGTVWGLFGDWGPGAINHYDLSFASYGFPTNEPAAFGGGPWDISKWDVRMRGEVSLLITGKDIGLGSSAITLTIGLKTFNFGTGVPYWYDFSGLGGVEGYFTLSTTLAKGTVYAPFDLKCTNAVGGAGLSAGPPAMFQWGLEIIGGGVTEALAVGPLGTNPGFPATGSVQVGVRNVYIVATRNDYEIHLFPCPAPSAGYVLTETL